MRFTKSRAASNALDRALNGDETISVSELKHASIVQRQTPPRKSAQKLLAERASGTKSMLEETLDRELATLARNAVKNGTRDTKAFLAAAKVAFDLAVCQEGQDDAATARE